MRTVIAIFVMLTMLGGGIFLWQSSKSATTSVEKSTTTNAGSFDSDQEVAAEIVMTDDAYTPSEVTIKQGQAVRFVNNASFERWPASNSHPTHDIYPEFDPLRGLKPGESWTFVFDKEGQWRMHDHIVPYLKGVIIVE